jgi:hypothetical protein
MQRQCGPAVNATGRHGTFVETDDAGIDGFRIRARLHRHRI